MGEIFIDMQCSLESNPLLYLSLLLGLPHLAFLWLVAEGQSKAQPYVTLRKLFCSCIGYSELQLYQKNFIP